MQNYLLSVSTICLTVGYCSGSLESLILGGTLGVLSLGLLIKARLTA